MNIIFVTSLNTVCMFYLANSSDVFRFAVNWYWC